MTDINIVAAFLRAMDMHKKEIVKAGELFGLSQDQISRRLRGEVPVFKADRLARMAARLQIREFEAALRDKDAHELARM